MISLLIRIRLLLLLLLHDLMPILLTLIRIHHNEIVVDLLDVLWILRKRILLVIHLVLRYSLHSLVLLLVRIHLELLLLIVVVVVVELLLLLVLHLGGAHL